LFFSYSENKAQWAPHGGNSESSVIIRILGKLGVSCAARTPGLGKTHMCSSAKMQRKCKLTLLIGSEENPLHEENFQCLSG
jgi:hypothetical protein